MTLDSEAFKRAFRDFFTTVESLPTSFDDAGMKWANLYAAYAKAAQAGATKPVSAAIDAQAKALGGALAGIFATPHDSSGLAMLASQIASAFTAFWPPVGFLAPGVVGVATSPLPAALIGSLADFFLSGNPASGPRPTGSEQADRMVTLLDGWTRTVTVVNTPAGAPPLPPVPLA